MVVNVTHYYLKEHKMPRMCMIIVVNRLRLFYFFIICLSKFVPLFFVFKILFENVNQNLSIKVSKLSNRFNINLVHLRY